MTSGLDSQNFESYLPVYDVVPSKWEDARAFLVEQFKRISIQLNGREIGWYLDQEVLTGKSFIPSAISNNGFTSQIYRTILRKVIEFPSLTAGVNTQPHEIDIDGNFTLIQLWGAATNATSLTGEPIPNGSDTISYDSTDIIITVGSNYTRAIAVIEYMQEL